MSHGKEPQIKKLEGLKEEHFGQLTRQVFFSPKTTHNSYLKMAYINAPPGSAGTPHVHLGEEIVYVLEGKAIFVFDGTEYLVEKGDCFLIPPEVEHPARVVGDENWVAVAAYCDECPVLKRHLDKEDTDYPVSTEESRRS
jgi:quercetin dioxygenase-like cupin family protein